MLDPLFGTIIIAIFPLAGALTLYYLVRGANASKKEWFFLLGFISVTTYFVFASSPEVVFAQYAKTGDYVPVALFGLLAMTALFVSLYFFRRHLE